MPKLALDSSEETTAALAKSLPPKSQELLLEDKMTEIAEQTRFDVTKREVRNHDATILVGYSILAIVLLIAIYFGSLSAGTAPSDFTSMTAFP
jgi:hypothetical protein